MKKTIIIAAAALIGLTANIAPSLLLPIPAAAQVTIPETSVYQNANEVPIAIYQIKIAIPPGTIIGRANRGLWGIVTQEWLTEDLGDASKFIPRVYRALRKVGYTSAAEENNQTAEGGSIFGNIMEGTVKHPTPQARFMVGGTITKTWMTAHDNGWGGWASDVDMKVTWEVYDTLQNKVILTQETYAIDEGGGITTAYYYTVMEKVAAKFFKSPEFQEAIQKNLAYTPAPAE